MNQTERKVRNKITVISFICSLLVMWIHSFNLPTYGIGADSVGAGKAVFFIETYWKNVTLIATSLFFVISGFLFFRTYTFKDTFTKYKSRFKSIFIPYICWCSIYYLFFASITNIPAIKQFMGEAEPIGLSVTTWLRWLGPDKYYTLWFLQDLIICIVLSPVIYLLLKNHKKFPVGTLILILGVLNVYFKWFSLPGGLIEYATGAWLAINYKDVVFYRNKALSIAAWIYIICLFATGFHWNGVVSEVLLLVALWFGLDIFSLEKELPWWMKITFFTYVAHDLVLKAISKILLLLFGSAPIWALITYILAPILVFAVLVFIATLLQRFLPHLWSVLTGAR